MNKSITVIPARKRVGNTVNKEVKPKLRVEATPESRKKKSQSSESQRTAASVQTAMSRLPVMMHR
jgi:hypothetical protein